MSDSQALLKIKQARGRLLDSAGNGFFGCLLLNLKLVEDSAIPTAAVDHENLYYNPAYVMSLPMPALVGLAMHEVLHPALGHLTRCGEYDLQTRNEACDYKVNQIIKERGVTLPDGALLDSRYNKMSAEQVCHALQAKKKGQGQGQPSQDQGQGQPSQGQGQDQGQGQPSQGQGQTKGQAAGGSIKHAGDSCGGFKPAAPEGSAKAEEIKEVWRERVSIAAKAAGSAGNLPADLKELIEGILKPKASASDLVREFFTDQKSQEPTWSRRNRRIQHINLPGCERDSLGSLVVAVDCSGSISMAALKTFNGMIESIANDLQVQEIHVVTCNTAIKSVKTFYSGEEIKIDVMPCGGTAFAPVFEHVEQAGWNPVGLIYLTDLDCYDTPPEPSYPVCWATYDSRRPAPFGYQVKID